MFHIKRELLCCIGSYPLTAIPLLSLFPANRICYTNISRCDVLSIPCIWYFMAATIRWYKRWKEEQKSLPEMTNFP